MEYSRRNLLATVGGAVGASALASTIGRAQPSPATSDTRTHQSTATQLDAPETWPSLQNGPANTGVASQSLPLDDLEATWNIQVGGSGWSPVVSDGTAVFTSLEGTVKAVDAANGAPKWSQEYDSRIEGPPVIVNGTVYIGTRDRVYALALAGGGEQWTADPPTELRGGGTATETSVFFGTASGVARFDAETGTLENTIGSGEVAGAPAVVDGVVYYGSTDGVFAAMLTGREQWQFASGTYAYRSVTVTDDTVFATTLDPDSVTSTFHALDRVDGTENWRVSADDRVDNFSPAATDELVFIRRDQSTLEARRVSDGSVEWSTSVEQEATAVSSPIVTASTVFAVFGQSLYAFDRETGNQQRSFDGDYARTPAVTGESLLAVRGNETVKLASASTAESSGTAQPTARIERFDGEFSAAASTPNDQLIAYEWDFGADGSVDRTGERIPASVDAQTLQLTVHTNDGRSDSTTIQLGEPSGVPTGWFGPLIGGALGTAYTGVWRRSKARRDEHTVSSNTRRLSMLGWAAVAVLLAGSLGLATAAPEMITPRLTTAGITAAVVIAVALGGVGAAVAGSIRAFRSTVFGVASAITGAFLGWALATRFWPPASLVSIPSWLLVAVLAGILIITGNTAILSWLRGESATPAQPSQPTNASDDEADTANDQDGEPAADDEEPSIDDLWGKADRRLIAADDMREDDPQAALEEYEQAAALFDELVDRVSDSDDRYEELTAGQTFAHDQVELLRDALD
ncbi:PQQ repeat protein [Haloferax gibbonsii]|uniref:PQQ repeat protein n=1 Tax=Haloferax gibbonsii TaxID=35746 RepID=A0A871BI34_HALGI|nr:PQQ-binding-like beta-propeller repeat protein [Haloferax gibbonsii]QOS12751.1 PQQ repeat protein [Haloferax gibbonsii]